MFNLNPDKQISVNCANSLRFIFHRLLLLSHQLVRHTTSIGNLSAKNNNRKNYATISLTGKELCGEYSNT